MNKRDFYKEIMEEYMFDKDKILANAKKGKLAAKKPLPLYIGMSTAVAAAVVIVGTGIMTMGNHHGANYDNSNDLAALSEQQRIQRAIEEMRKNQNSSELQDVLVTFARPLTPAEARGVITEFSDIPVKMLYMEDGSTVSGSSEIETVFNSGSDKINGAVINCAGYMISALNDNQNVFLTEIVTNKNLEGLNPVKSEEPIENNSNTNSDTAPVNGDKNNMGGTGGTGGTGDIDGTGVGGNLGGDPDYNDNSSPNGGNSMPDTSDTTDDPTVSAGSQPDNSNTSDTTSAINTKDKLPEGVKLPDSYEKPSYITDDVGAQRTYFISEDVYYVKSADEVRLYRYNGESETLLAKQAVSDAKVCWISESGSRMMITGCENGVRSKMFILDATNGTINDMHIEDMVLGGSVAEAAYSELYDTLALNILEDDTNYIYTANLTGYVTASTGCAVSGTGLSILAAKNGAVYYSEFDGENTSVMKYTGEYSEIARLGGAYSTAANSAFSFAVLSGAERFILDPGTDKLIPISGNGDISFGISSDTFSLGDEYYTVSGGTISPVKANAAVMKKIDFKRSLSAKYMALVSNGSVRIIPATYSAKALSETLTFIIPNENASAAQRAAVNAGLGLTNALAGRMCAKCGIDTADKLSDTIKACFTKTAGSELKARCGITDGSSEYSDGGLSQVNISETVLVMDNSTSGTLYIKAGTFNGKTAYFSRSIKLAEENGSLKLDIIVD